MQRPPLTQRVLALPVIRPPISRLNGGAPLASEREAREFNEVLSTFAYLSQQSEELPDPPPHWEMEYMWFPTHPPIGKLNTFDFPPTPH